ncbi:MAG: hypothetical protein Q9227_003753 [Pyrenula ochraceoflavens]
MKASFIAILALVAAPALAQVDEIAARNPYVGSLAARANEPTEIQSSSDAAAPDAAAAQVFCRLPTSAVSGAPPGAANIDGTCIAVNTCFADGGRAFTGVCPSGACCIKNDCAGPNSNSACLLPNLAGDTLRPGQSGRFVNGACPGGLRCFQLTS